MSRNAQDGRGGPAPQRRRRVDRRWKMEGLMAEKDPGR